MRLQPKPIALDPSLSFSCFHRVEPVFAPEWHYHPEYELTLIESGSGQRFVGSHIAPFKPGDLVLLGPGLPQTWASEKPGADGLCRATVAQWSELGGLGQFIARAPELAPVRRMLARAAHGLHFPAGRALAPLLARLAVLPELPPAPRLAEFLAILDALAARPAQTIDSGAVTALSAGEAAHLDRALRFIQTHLAEDLRHGAAARLLGMSPHAFSRFFKRATGRTFTDHVNELRLCKAAQLLTETALPVAEVAGRSGYANASYFHRRFRARHGLSALAYRRKRGK